MEIRPNSLFFNSKLKKKNKEKIVNAVVLPSCASAKHWRWYASKTLGSASLCFSTRPVPSLLSHIF